MRSILLAGACVGLGCSAASAATPFDGAWTVSQNCPPTGQDVRGYAWTYGATVRNGAFSGMHSPSSAQDGSLRLVGRIGPDGEARLAGTGRTGRSEYSVGHVAQGYPVHFSVAAHFTATSGSGTRTEQRTCDFSFTKN